MGDALYRDDILSEHRNPRNYGLRDDFDLEIRGNNFICGDSMTVRLKLDGDTIIDASFVSDSCVISRASGSLCSDYIKGKTRDEVVAISSETVESILKLPLSPARIKCAMLFLDTVRKAI